MKEKLREDLTKILTDMGVENPKINLEYPEKDFGDISSNVAMTYAKHFSQSPINLAEEIKKRLLSEYIETVQVVNPGFLNFKFRDAYIFEQILTAIENKKDFGKNKSKNGVTMMVEYTDPNPFKIFHIGHLMANVVGESISRLAEFSDAKIIRACYQGDVGLHVAKTLWATIKSEKESFDVDFLGQMYVLGNEKYDTDPVAKEEIIEINKKIFNKSDKNINRIYEYGMKISMDYFDKMYARLGTHFDKFYLESQIAQKGKNIVEKNKGNVFSDSDGAVIFKGEEYGLHTRVFINSYGLPTYDAKEIGLTIQKFEDFNNLDESVVISANEQDQYFKVVIKAIELIDKDISKKMRHISHGLLRPASGKMSSRKGNIVPAEALLNEFVSISNEKLKERDMDVKEKDEIAEAVAVAGLRFNILRQSVGGDVIYDPEKDLSFEGDSGPYIQYSYVRAMSILAKSENKKVSALPAQATELEKTLLKFPEFVNRSIDESSPHHICTYLLNLSSAFNHFYTNHKIIEDSSESAYRVQLVTLFTEVMEKGMWLLGIKNIKKM